MYRIGLKEILTHRLLAEAPHSQHRNQHAVVPGLMKKFKADILCQCKMTVLLKPHSRMACKVNGGKRVVHYVRFLLCKFRNLRSEIRGLVTKRAHMKVFVSHGSVQQKTPSSRKLSGSWANCICECTSSFPRHISQ